MAQGHYGAGTLWLRDIVAQGHCGSGTLWRRDFVQSLWRRDIVLGMSFKSEKANCETPFSASVVGHPYKPQTCIEYRFWYCLSNFSSERGKSEAKLWKKERKNKKDENA